MREIKPIVNIEISTRLCLENQRINCPLWEQLTVRSQWGPGEYSCDSFTTSSSIGCPATSAASGVVTVLFEKVLGYYGDNCCVLRRFAANRGFNKSFKKWDTWQRPLRRLNSTRSCVTLCFLCNYI